MDRNERQELKDKVAYYNEYCPKDHMKLSYQDGKRSVGYGVLHIYWGVDNAIRLLPQDGVPVIKEAWQSGSMQFDQTLHEIRDNMRPRSNSVGKANDDADVEKRKPRRNRPSTLSFHGDYTSRRPKLRKPSLVSRQESVAEEDEDDDEEFVDAPEFPAPVRITSLYTEDNSSSDEDGFHTPEAEYEVVLEETKPQKSSVSEAAHPPRIRRFNTICYRGERRPDVEKRPGRRHQENSSNSAVSRRKRRSRRGKRYHTVVWGGDTLASINGHLFDPTTCVCTPAHGSIASVFTTTDSPTPVVLQQLLDKFKIDQSTDDFNLYVVRESGETKALGPADMPLLERIRLGPHEDAAKIVIKEKSEANVVSHEVAQYLRLPMVTLQQMLALFEAEQKREEQRIRDRIFSMRLIIQGFLDEKNASNESRA